jgi:hypothetical protein
MAATGTIWAQPRRQPKQPPSRIRDIAHGRTSLPPPHTLLREEFELGIPPDQPDPRQILDDVLRIEKR